jgi:hypothetical protein
VRAPRFDVVVGGPELEGDFYFLGFVTNSYVKARGISRLFRPPPIISYHVSLFRCWRRISSRLFGLDSAPLFIIYCVALLCCPPGSQPTITNRPEQLLKIILVRIYRPRPHRSINNITTIRPCSLAEIHSSTSQACTAEADPVGADRVAAEVGGVRRPRTSIPPSYTRRWG